MQSILKLYRALKSIFYTRWLMTNSALATLDKYRRELLAEEKYENPLKLNRFEFQVFSQNGEDGIIAEIFNRIGCTNKTFLEIGVGNGLENNTVYLLLQGWKGYWIDGDKGSIKFIHGHFREEIRDKKLFVKEAIVTVENVSSLISEVAGLNIDLLSLDIDRNTYWTLEQVLQTVSPRVIVVEYNGLFPPTTDWKVEYNPDLVWKGSSYSGASLKAYEVLCQRFGYSLVGCEICGVNSFFVKNELCGDKFLHPLNSTNHYEPLREFLVHKPGLMRRFRD